MIIFVFAVVLYVMYDFYEYEMGSQVYRLLSEGNDVRIVTKM